MNKINYIIFIFIYVISITNGQTKLSPQSAATAQTFGTFSDDLDAVNWNPAILGYYNFDNPTILNIASVDSNQNYYSVQLIANTDKKRVKETRKTFHRKFDKNIPWAIIKMDSLYKLQVGDFRDRITAEIFRDSVLIKGYKDAWIIKDDEPLLKTEQKLKEERFDFEFLNLGAMLSNSSADANWINNYILNGDDVGELDVKGKNNIISVFPDDGWRLNPIINYKFGLRIKNFALQVSPDIFGEFVIPTGLIKLVFNGNEISEPINFSGRKNQFQAVLPLTFSYGMKTNIPILEKYVHRSFIGINAKYLAGLAYFESASKTFTITPDSDQISLITHIKTKYSLAGAYMEVDTSKSFNYLFITDIDSISLIIPAGSGYAFDLGFIMDINDKVSASIAFTNLLGQITWGKETAYEHELKQQTEIPMEEESQDQLDSLFQTGIEIDTNIAITSFKTKYPGFLILGAEYSFDKLKLASNLKFGFNNELGSSTTPRFSLGAEFRPVKWFSLLGGTSIGGFEGFQWGTGFRMRASFLQFICAYSEYGGMLNSAKGFSLSASTSIIF